METLMKKLSLLAFISLLISTTAMAGGKINCNETIYPASDEVSQALFEADIQPAQSLESAKYAIQITVTHDSVSISDGLTMFGGCGFFVCGSKAFTYSIATLFTKNNADWVKLNELYKSSSNINLKSTGRIYPESTNLIKNALKSLLNSVCE